MAEHSANIGGFEDQVRRMFVSNAPNNSGQPPHQSTMQRPVNVPSRQPRQHGVQAPPPPQNGARNGQINNGAPSQAAANGKHPGQPRQLLPQRPSQRERRMHPQMQPGQTPVYPVGNHGQHAPQRHPQPQQRPIDPDAFQRGGRVAGYYQQPQGPPRQLFNPNAVGAPQQISRGEQHTRQARYLEEVASIEIAKVSMSQHERDEKEAFRVRLEKVIHDVCAADSERLPKVSLKAFGSFRSGFANAGSDMDLVIVLPDGTPFTASFGLLENDLPRALEKRLLQLGYGARLLTRTRVPIIKICEKPDDCLLDKLRQEREGWDALPNEKKYPHLHPEGEVGDNGEASEAAASAESKPKAAALRVIPDTETGNSTQIDDTIPTEALARLGLTDKAVITVANVEQALLHQVNGTPSQQTDKPQSDRPKRDMRPFTRERKAGPLDFPKEGVGIQSDINFFNPLGLHNTQLLRCYSLCDPRVTPMVLFVKSWAKRRKINSSYSGTLSSYGYVLMVLHYLVNVVHPAVLPNLQSPWRPDQQTTPYGAKRVDCDGWTVDFWREEAEILQAQRTGQMSTNQESLGSLLVGFFSYYSSIAPGPQFIWTQHVLSLRSPGGIMSKEEKGWVKAVTEEGEGKKVQHRYLFCIEDPFELAHNVARTVTHMGIVAIRDEFRRARRILMAISFGQQPAEGQLFDQLVEPEPVENETPTTSNGFVAVEGTAETTTGRLPDLNAKSEAAKSQNQTRFSQNKRGQMNGSNPRPPPAASKPLNVTDQDAFPALGLAKARPAGRNMKEPKEADSSEISGDAAKAYLEELKRKKAEADAELTATGAAEAVLGDD